MAAVNEKAALKQELYRRSVRYRNDYVDPQLNQVAEYLWGDQNIRRATAEDQNDFVVNICFKQYQILQSILCRDVPGLTLRMMMPGEEWDITRDTVQKLVMQNWRLNEMPIRMVELTSNGIPFNNAFFKITWDKTMRMGLGDMRIEVPDSRNIIFLPGIATVRKSLVMYERKYVDKLTALHMFPDQKEAIDALFSLSYPQSSQGQFTGGGNAQYATSAGYSTYSWESSAAGTAPERANIELVEEWSIDSTTLKMVPELFGRIEKTTRYKSMTGDEQYSLANRPLYPRGRLCVFSGMHEFSSAPNPFPSFPYVQYRGLEAPAAKPGDEYGPGALDVVLEIQDMLNTRQNQVMDAMDHSAMGGFGMAGLGVVDPDEFDSKPRRVYVKKMPGDFDWYSPPTVPAEAFKSLSDIRAMGDDVMNIHGITSSGDTKDLRSGEGVESLIELSNRVLAPSTYSLEACYRSLVRYQIHMMGSPFYKRGIHYHDGVDLSGISPDAFEIYITAGLNLPMSKQSSQQTLFRMRELEAIDNEALLDSVDISILPDKADIKERMRQKEIVAQQQAQQQMQSEVAAKNAQAQASMASVIPMPQGA